MQIDTTFNKKHNGAGLGLAIAKKYSDAMGGIIRCESVEGEGSRFIFTKTFKISNEKEVLFPMKTFFDSNLDKKNKNILSVDDSSINQNIMKTILERRGYNVLIAYNGEEAKAILEKKDIDLIFMDIQLPDINGLKLTKIIREDAKLRGIPIIAMTAYAQQEDRLKCVNSGMNDYMTKPIDIDEIKRILEIYLKKDS
jgi:CheY-like chemotaxis protein